MTTDFVRFERVEKSFGEKQVYSDLTLGIRRGEVLTLLGGSGTGKSVALKLLIGLLSADAGKIEVDGVDVAHFTEEQFLPIRKRISILFQSSALFDSLTVGENVAYPLAFAGSFSAGEIRDRVAQRLEMVGLPGTEAMKPSDLSGGMRKRIGLARAIVADPEMILYDEPTTGLDPVNTRRINELILSIQERLRMTSLVVTHDLPSAFMVSNRLAMLSRGKIVAVLPGEEFRRSPERAIQEFMAAMPVGAYRPHAEPPPAGGAAMSEAQNAGQRVRVALFLLVTLAVAIGAVLILGRSRSFFARKAVLHASFQNTGGLLAGSAVRLAGVDVGTVRAIHFDRDPKIRKVNVDLTVRLDDLVRIRKDSVAQVTSKGLLGDMIVDITLGSQDQPPLADGDRIDSAEAAGLGQVVEGLGQAISRVDVLAGDVDLRVRELLTPQVAIDLGRIAHSTAAVMEGVEHGRGLAHELLYQPELASDVGQAVQSLQHSITDLDGILAQARNGNGLLHGLVFDPRGGQAVDQLEKIATALEDIVTTVKDGHGVIHSLVYEDDKKNLVQDLAETARIVRELAQQTEQGKGTLGGLLRDPTVYEDLTTVLGNLKRNELLKALIRFTIVKDGLERPGRVEAPGSSP